MPDNTTKEDLLRLKLMNEEDFQSLHQSRVVVFEKNPIKDKDIKETKSSIFKSR